MGKLRILGSTRLSNLTDESTSIARQRRHILADPLTTDGEVVDIIEDVDVSADAGKFPLFKRPALGPWLNERTDEYDVLMFALADRAIRSQLDLYELSQWAIKHRKMVVFVKGPADGPRMVLDFRKGPLDPMTQFLAGLFAFVGEIELGIIKARARDSRIGARRDGRWHGGRPPYGYKAVKGVKGSGWRLEREPDAIKVIEGIIDRLLGGEPVHAIANSLNEEGVLTPRDSYNRRMGKSLRGDRWTSTTIRNLLRNRTLLGQSVYQGRVIRDSSGAPILRGEPLISRSTFDAVQARLDDCSRQRVRSRTTSPLLGVAFCLGCGGTLYRFNYYDPVRAINYRCSNRIYRKTDCTMKPVASVALTEIIEEEFLSHVGDLEILEPVFIPGESHEDELREAVDALQELLEMRRGKSEAIRAVYDQQIEALEIQIDRLGALPSTPSRTEYQGTGRSYRQLWESSGESARRRLLLDAKVRIEAAQVEGPAVSLGRFDRSGRSDQALRLGMSRGLQYAFYLPVDLVSRITQQRQAVY